MHLGMAALRSLLPRHATELCLPSTPSTPSPLLSLWPGHRGIWGTAGIDGANIDGAIKNEGDYDKITRRVERVDEVVKEDVLVMKIGGRVCGLCFVSAWRCRVVEPVV